MYLLSILFFYHGLIGSGNITPSILQEYLVVDSLVSGIDSQTMHRIAKCESGFNQFNKDGSPLVSKTSDVGLMQINQVHWKRAKKLGLDIFNSPIDNLEMAKIIYKEQGYKAWSCYNRKVSDGT